MDDIITLALSATTVAKALVDMAKLAVDLPRWASPALALVVGVGAVLLLMVASGAVLTVPMLAQAVLSGVLAAAGAVGVTELSRRTDVVRLARRG